MCEAKEKIITLSQEDAMILCYDEEEYREYVRQRRTEDEVREAKIKFKKEGKKESSIDIAKKLLEEKVNIDITVKATGLSKDEIEKL